MREALSSSGRRLPVGCLRPRRAFAGNRKPEAASGELTALLKRHRPLLQNDHLDECGGFQDSDALAMRGRQGFVDVAYGRARARLLRGQGAARTRAARG